MSIKKFQKLIWKYYKDHGRHNLLWRQTNNPYYILVSEVMLQQTQVSRVIDFYQNWIEKFPTIQTLASAQQKDVLSAWSGLGYNSRGLRLHQLAKKIVEEHDGVIPEGRDELEGLPGIGPYTAGAVRAFAFNKVEVFIETNIRRVFIHHFFSGEERKISDKELFPFIEKTLPKETSKVKEWYWALMDYGSTLPKIAKYNSNKKSRTYTKQSKFEGSRRQLRAGIIKMLLAAKNGMVAHDVIYFHMKRTSEEIESVICDLEKEGFLVRKDGRVLLV